MITVNYVLVADKVILEEGGKPSVIGIFDHVIIPKGTSSIALPLTVFIRVSDVPLESLTAVVNINKPDSSLLKSVVITGDNSAPGSKRSVNLRAIFSLLNIQDKGIYTITLKVNGQDIDCSKTGSDFFEVK